MAGLFTEQAAVYAAARPVYPKDLFAKLAALTAHRSLAWDVGTGNGQAAISVSSPTPCSRSVFTLYTPAVPTVTSAPCRPAGCRALRQRAGHGRERGAAAARRPAPEGPVPPHPRRHARGRPRRCARRRGLR